ncbi:hypothetical protein BHM03_00055380 [Ensete ventricosum]|nr:hypothetical protein BHM03_00055380 [Ensete ventricosum]
MATPPIGAATHDQSPTGAARADGSRRGGLRTWLATAAELAGVGSTRHPRRRPHWGRRQPTRKATAGTMPVGAAARGAAAPVCP